MNRIKFFTHFILLCTTISSVTSCASSKNTFTELNRKEYIELHSLGLSIDDENLIYYRNDPYNATLREPIQLSFHDEVANKCYVAPSERVSGWNFLSTESGHRAKFDDYLAKFQPDEIPEFGSNFIVLSYDDKVEIYHEFLDSKTNVECLALQRPQFNFDKDVTDKVFASVNDLTISDDHCWIAFYVDEQIDTDEDFVGGYLFDSRHIKRLGKYLVSERNRTIYASKLRQDCSKSDDSEPKLSDPIRVHSIKSSYLSDDKINLDISSEQAGKVRFAFDSGHNAFSLNGDVLLTELVFKDKEWKPNNSEPVNISNRDPSIDGWDGNPKFSPDGEYLAFIRQDVPQDEAAMRDVFRKNLRTGQLENLTQGLDYPINQYYWSCNGDCLLAEAYYEGNNALFLISPKAQTVEKIDFPDDMPPYIHEFVVTRSEDKIFVIASSFDKPNEIYCLQRSHDSTYNKCSKWQYTNENQKFLIDNEDYLPRVKVLSAQSDNVLGEVPFYLLQPNKSLVKHSNKLPLILSVHGGPTSVQYNKFDLDIATISANGYAIALPNPTGSLGFGQEYTDAVKNEWGGQVYDDLVAVLDELVNRSSNHNLDIEKFGAMGISYGGYMMAWLQSHPPLLQSNKNFKLKALVTVNGIYDLHSWSRTTDELWYPIDQLKIQAGEFNPYHQFNPAQYSEHFSNIPTLLIAGGIDDRVPMNQSIQYFTALKDNCVPARLVILPTGWHGFTPHGDNEKLSRASKMAWFDQFLKNETPEKGPTSHTIGFTSAEEAYLSYTDISHSENCNQL